VAVEHEWGMPVDVDRVMSAHPNPAIIAAVHAETSTGCQSDAKLLTQIAHKQGALVIVDAVTSLGGTPVKVDEWEIDAIYSASQKCLSCTPGLSPVSFSERVVEHVKRRKDRIHSWFMDMNLLLGYWGESTRTYHHTAPVAMVASLHAGLRRILDEGLENVWARHEEAGRMLQTGLQEMGLELFAAEGHRLPELTTVRVPDGVDSAAVRRYLLERHNLEIGAGAGEFASTVWRIGLMGHNARPDAALLALAALEDALKAVG